MKIFIDFIPIIVFFAAFKLWGIYAATGAAIAAVLIHVVTLLILRKKVSSLLWLNLGIIAIFGGATIFFKNEWFIKLKPTVLYFIIAAIFFISDRFFNKNLFKLLSNQSVTLSDDVWKFLLNSWVLFFLIMGLLNFAVAIFATTEMWVNFKLFGLLGATFLFAIFQALYISKKAGV